MPLRLLLILFVVLAAPHVALAGSLPVGAGVPDTNIGEFDPDAWKGKPYIINFFATWCVPCRAEQPALNQLAKAGIPIIGIAYRNRSYKVENFLAQGNPYKDLAYDPRGAGGYSWQISGVPETFLVDRNGLIQGHFSAPLTASLVETDVLPLWRQLN